MLEWIKSHPEIAIYLALAVVTLVKRRETALVEWAGRHPRVAGALKIAQAIGIDPIKIIDGVYMLLVGRLSVSKAATFQRIVDAIAKGAIVLALIGCQPVRYPTDLPEAVRLARVGIEKTGDALELRIATLPTGASTEPWETYLTRLEAADATLMQADATVKDACAVVPSVLPVAKSLGCTRCEIAFRAAARVCGQ
jgi:hypothetical protein